MNGSLSLRIVMMTVATILISLLLFIIVFNALGHRALMDLGSANDRLSAQRLAPWLERYFQQQRSFEGAMMILGGVPATTSIHVPMMNSSGMNRRPVRETPLVVTSSIALFTADGRFIAGVNLPEDFSNEEPNSRNGVRIFYDNREIARLYLGSMIENRLGPLERRFLSSLRTAAAAALGVTALGAVLLALFVSRYVTKPVKRTAEAAEAIAGGNFAVTLDTSRKDELGQLAKSFSKMAQEIEAQEKTRKRFIADAAHELRTPLSLVSSQLELIEEGVYPLDKAQIDRINRHLHRMTRLVTDLQTLARLDADGIDTIHGKFTFQPEELFSSVVHSFQSTAAERSLKLDFQAGQLGNTEITITEDPTKIEQILVNVISNALRYAPEKSEITISVLLDREEIHWIVADHGPGIPQELRERVFDRFYRVDESRNRRSGGSGLGLAICREIVDRLHGRIWIEETPGGGTTVHTAVPISWKELSTA